MENLSSPNLGDAAPKDDDSGSVSSDEKRRSLAELKRLWEGMAINSEHLCQGRSGGGENQPKHNRNKSGIAITRAKEKESPKGTESRAITTSAKTAKFWQNQLGSSQDVATKTSPKSVDQSRNEFHDRLGESTPRRATSLSSLLEQEPLSCLAKRGDEGDPPIVVRGSILVQNSMDMLGWPRLLDVVETSDSDEGIVVEQNTNLFHGKYHQIRQNPVYFSDQEDESESGTRIRRKEKTGRGERKGHAAGVKDAKPPDTWQHGLSNGVKLQLTLDKDVQRKATDDDQCETMNSTAPVTSHTVKVDGQNRTDIFRIMDNSSDDSVHQTITVKRTDEELTSEMKDALMKDQANGVVNVDVVHESIDVELSRGVAQVKVVVHCERIVPSRKIKDTYRKSCATVTRLTEIDMLATPERSQLYNRIMMSFTNPESSSQVIQGALVQKNRLSAEDVYRLYAIFVEVIAGSESINHHEQLNNSSPNGKVTGLELLRQQGLPLTFSRLGQLAWPVLSTQ